MSLLDAYRKKLEAQIQEHKAKLNLLKARAQRVAAQSRIVGYEELAQADKHLDHVKARFKELRGAGGTAFGEIKTGVQKALADLKVSTQKAAKHFSAHINHAPPPSAKPRPRTKHTKPAKHAAKVVRHSKVAKVVKRAAKAATHSKAAKVVKGAAKSARHVKNKKH